MGLLASIGEAIAKADVFGERATFLDSVASTANVSRDLNSGPFKEIDDALSGSNEKNTIVIEEFRDAFRDAALKAVELGKPDAEKAFVKVATLAQQAIEQITLPEVNTAELRRIRDALARAVEICLMWKSPSSLRSFDG